PIFMKTVPGTPAGHSAPSSSATMTSLIGHGLPTVPGRSSHSAGVTVAPPPSVAAEYSYTHGPHHTRRACFIGTGQGAAAWISQRIDDTSYLDRLSSGSDSIRLN